MFIYRPRPFPRPTPQVWVPPFAVAVPPAEEIPLLVIPMGMGANK